MSKKWYGLLVATQSYAAGAHLLDWELDLKPELDLRRISYAAAKKAGTEPEALKWVRDNSHRAYGLDGPERERHARAQGGRCWYCGQVLNMNRDAYPQPNDAELEHLTPKSRGGGQTVTSCRTCNNPANGGKGNRTLEEYRASLLGRFPGKTHLHFYGEWLRHVKERAALGQPTDAQAFVRAGDALAFPAELLTD
ncbi:HNH endonuclease [Deinococcus detaillensis]|uniref:HNH endonuclease n=1 Tax=Deinococcus detaillensis TaxID=2592048 RepID=A0A553UPN4_9DEIO|nr:HNH endonuclease [Deinococcus detaillensis]TSA82145.1 HNH endonuclease [Deinococcus detaillensis]